MSRSRQSRYPTKISPHVQIIFLTSKFTFGNTATNIAIDSRDVKIFAFGQFNTIPLRINRNFQIFENMYYICSAGILQGWVHVKKLAIIYSTSYVRFGDGVRGEGGKERWKDLHSLTPTPLLFFYHQPSPWYKFLSLPSLPLPWKKDSGNNFC